MTNAETITRQLGGRWHGYYGIARCPAHNDRSPSLSIRDGDKCTLFRCHAGCEQRNVLVALRHDGLLGPDVPVRSVGRRDAPQEPQEATQALNLEIALRIWHTQTKPLAGTLGARYFTKHRHVDVAKLGNLTHCLRFHPGKQMIVALMRDPLSGEERGIHRILLNPNGSKRERKMLGPKGIICLSLWTEVTHGLGLSEGIEKALHILSGGWCPVWAAPDCGAMANFPILSGVEFLSLFADNDAPGLKAADECAHRWIQQGREANVIPASAA